MGTMYERQHRCQCTIPSHSASRYKVDDIRCMAEDAAAQVRYHVDELGAINLLQHMRLGPLAILPAL
eukprot:11561339-Alexandrium_andersonii.AAC.1